MKTVPQRWLQRPRRALALALTASCILGGTAASPGQGIRIGTNTTVLFAGIEAGRDLLTRRDGFIGGLTALDRRARMKSEVDVSETDFVAFVGRSVQAWTAEESNRIAGAFRLVADRIARWPLPFPTNILLVKTSGEEEFNNCYTRQNAIVIPAAEAASGPSMLRYLILHELFHVLSRHDPDLRKTLYESIGFKPIHEIELPEELRGRKVTNPDGVQNGWVIDLTNQNLAVRAVPILLANGPSFNPNERGASPYDYFRLLVVKPDGTNWAPESVGGHPRLLKPSDATGWFEQIGRNTRYTIHPDEILADNFAHFINGVTNLPTPRILTGMSSAFRALETRK